MVMRVDTHLYRNYPECRVCTEEPVCTASRNLELCGPTLCWFHYNSVIKTNWAWDNSYLIIPTLLWTSMTFGLRTNTRGRASLNSHSQISCPRHDIGTTITILLSLISVLIYSTSHPWCRTTVQTRWVPMWFILRDVTDPVQWFAWSVDMGKGLWSLGKTRSQWRRGPERSGGVTYVGTAVPSN